MRLKTVLVTSEFFIRFVISFPGHGTWGCEFIRSVYSVCYVCCIDFLWCVPGRVLEPALRSCNIIQSPFKCKEFIASAIAPTLLWRNSRIDLPVIAKIENLLTWEVTRTGTSYIRERNEIKVFVFCRHCTLTFWYNTFAKFACRVMFLSPQPTPSFLNSSPCLLSLQIPVVPSAQKKTSVLQNETPQFL